MCEAPPQKIEFFFGRLVCGHLENSRAAERAYRKPVTMRQLWMSSRDSDHATRAKGSIELGISPDYAGRNAASITEKSRGQREGHRPTTAGSSSANLGEGFRRVTMQLLWHAVASCKGGFVRDPFTMIAAPVQSDFDGITKRPHHGRLQTTASTIPKSATDFGFLPPLLRIRSCSLVAATLPSSTRKAKKAARRASIRPEAASAGRQGTRRKQHFHSIDSGRLGPFVPLASSLDLTAGKRQGTVLRLPRWDEARAKEPGIL